MKFPEKDLMADILDNNFKAIVQRTKENVEKTKKMMYEQYGNMNKETENLERNKK